MNDSEWTLAELLSRVPEVRDLWVATFQRHSPLLPVRITGPNRLDKWHTLLIEEPAKCDGLTGLRDLVAQWRRRFPWLSQWRFESAYVGWDRVTVRFASLLNDLHYDEFSPNLIDVRGGEHETAKEKFVGATPLDVAPALAPMAGGFLDRRTYVAESCDGLSPAEFSVHLMTLFAMSSLVRYRADMWVHAITRSSLSERPADDHAIALIEQFLDSHALTAPEFVVTALDPSADPYSTATDGNHA